MGYPVTLNGRTYTLADFEGQNYAAGFPDALEDFVTNAGTQVTAAANSATAAATSATTAQGHATAALNSAVSAQASLDAIEGLYLGAQASNPTVDLNGDALTAGDWYFNTTSNSAVVYDGSAWNTITSYELSTDASPQLGGDLDVNGNAIVSTSNGNIAITPNGTGEVDISKVDIDGGAIDGTVIGGTTAAAGTFTNLTASGTLSFPDNSISGDDIDGGTISNFASTGIDDNATSTAITIDSSQNVGIGTTSPADYHSLSQFVVAQSGDAGITIASGTANDGRIFFADGTTGTAESEGTIAYNHSDNSMSFSTSDTQRLTIDSSGNVGISTSSPTQTLDVNGNIQSTGSNSRIIAGTAGQGQVALTLNDGGGNANLTFNHAGNAPDISGNNAGRITVNTDSTTNGSMAFEVGTAVTGAMVPNFQMYATGDFHADGNVIAYSTTISDERLKDDVQDITGALDTVDALRGVTYTWNAGSREGKRDYGVIAQEVERVIPEIVHDTPLPLINGDEETIYKTVDYEKLCAVLVNAVSELRAEVEALKNATS